MVLGSETFDDYEAQKLASPDTKPTVFESEHAEAIKSAIKEMGESQSPKLSTLPEFELISADLPAGAGADTKEAARRAEIARIDGEAGDIRTRVQSADHVKDPEARVAMLAKELGKITDHVERDKVIERFNAKCSGIKALWTPDGNLKIEGLTIDSPIKTGQESRYSIVVEPKTGKVLDVLKTAPGLDPTEYSCAKGSENWKEGLRRFNTKVMHYPDKVRGIRH